MAQMIMMGEEDKQYIDSKGNVRTTRKGNFSNPKAVEFLIRYITRTRENEEYRENLISYGMHGVANYGSIDDVILQFKRVQQTHGVDKSGGRLMYHFVYAFSDLENVMLGKNYGLVYAIGWNQSNWFFEQGYQVVFAIHDDSERHIHIHYAINAFNFLNGYKFHFDNNLKQQVDNTMNQIAIYEYQKYCVWKQQYNSIYGFKVDWSW